MTCAGVRALHAPSADAAIPDNPTVRVWKDRRTVYYQFTRITRADPETFRHLNQAFYADAKRVYWSDTKLSDADVKTFRTFGSDSPYSVDKQHVWFGASRVVHVDAASFRFLHNHVFADKDGVYMSGRGLSVIDADAPTFRSLAELESGDCVLFRDARRAYLFDLYYIEVYTLTRTRETPSKSPSPSGSARQSAPLVTPRRSRRPGRTVPCPSPWSRCSRGSRALRSRRGKSASFRE